ncbi:MAG: metallophosphoesterase [Rickettsiales bacterium]|jgi:hypothetical protein|nr:metallophosphoesterase [Rickettsiales bacterium]
MPKELEALKERIRNLFQPAVEANNTSYGNREGVKQKINKLIDIIVSGKTIELDNVAEEGELVFETDLHGDMGAFLNTLLKNGMVEYDTNNPTGIVFCDPQENKEYTLEELEAKKKISPSREFTDLMNRVQMLPAVEPTEKFKNYINCGDFVDRGKQSEQMIPLVMRLCKKFKDSFPNSEEGPIILRGNHEGFYADGDSRNALGNGGNFLLVAENSTDSENDEKFRTIASLTRKAIYDETLKLAHSVKNTLFSHTVITKNMVKNLAKNLSELSKDPGLANVPGIGEGVSVEETAETFRRLNDHIENDEEFKENDIKDLASALNNFNILRTKLVEYREKAKNKTPYLKGEENLIEMMNGSFLVGGDYLYYKDNITWERRNGTSRNDLIRDIKYVVGHDPVMAHESNLALNNKVLYADTVRSSGYNKDGKTEACYFHCEKSALGGSSFREENIHREEENKELGKPYGGFSFRNKGIYPEEKNKESKNSEVFENLSSEEEDIQQKKRNHKSRKSG